MYLKTLTLKGFKSFADRTNMVFDPGLTVVVGPNGSGKSNVSDAILWVLGEQSAKQLRGQAMEDVIFSGSSARKPVGLAEVTLVLDNSDHTLPIDFTEVAITRRMYRSGESEYLINNAPSRLMDITDILHCTTRAWARTPTPSSARASSTPSWPAAPRSAARSSRRPPASPSTAGARSARSASFARCRRTSRAPRTSSARLAAS